MLPVRVTTRLPIDAVSVPSSDVAGRPNNPVIPNASCPPSTGVANT